MAATTSDMTIRLKLDISSEDRRYLDTLQLLKERHVQPSTLTLCATCGCQNPASEHNVIKSSLYGLGPVVFYLCDICHTDYKESQLARIQARY